jgi:Flp pilus assembly pilin Flp
VGADVWRGPQGSLFHARGRVWQWLRLAKNQGLSVRDCIIRELLGYDTEVNSSGIADEQYRGAEKAFDEAEQQAAQDKLDLRAALPAHFVAYEVEMKRNFGRLWREEDGQDIAEYAVMLAVILAIVVATVQLIGKSANNVFSSVASTIQ